MMDSIVAWDRLEHAVDQLAQVLEAELAGHDETICGLDFAETKALAEVLDAGRHTDVAAKLMHRWALTEPNWNDEHGDIVRHWLTREHTPDLAHGTEPAARAEASLRSI